jgi:uncharacterized protein YhbP (UPF0306 family)
MPIERSRTPIDGARIASIARQLLDASALCSIATVSPQGQPHANTAYFAWSDSWDLVWLSEPTAQHSRNVRANGLTAITVYDSQQVWGNPDRGIQLFGRARELSGRAARNAEALYAQRFTAYAQTNLSAYRWYRCHPQRMKLFDERELGTATFVTARIRRDGQVTWEGTDIYLPSA